jgi:hypothetical protein
MFVVLHGAAGGWDELAIAVAAFAVLWVAFKLAGRKAAEDDDEADDALQTETPPAYALDALPREEGATHTSSPRA